MSEVLLLDIKTDKMSVRFEPPRAKRPDPAWVRGRCPLCGDDVVSNLYYFGGKGYLVRWECWSSLGEEPSCGYRKDL
jgi:hypothetical protein